MKVLFPSNVTHRTGPRPLTDEEIVREEERQRQQGVSKMPTLSDFDVLRRHFFTYKVRLVISYQPGLPFKNDAMLLGYFDEPDWAVSHLDAPWLLAFRSMSELPPPKL